MAESRVVRQDAPDRDHRSFLWAVFALAIAGLWLPAITSSLWLDETGTWWVIKDGLSSSIGRAAKYQGQTPAYYVFAWMMRHVLGRSEVMLRLPALLAMGASAYVLYRLAKRLFEPETAVISTICFAAAEGVAFAAIDARPYAFAILSLLASTLCLVRWLDGESKRDPYVYVALLAATIYLHFIFAIALIPQAVYAYQRRRRINWRVVLGVVGGVLILLSPALPQLWSLFRRRDSLSVPTGQIFGDALEYIAPPVLIVGGMLGAIAARARHKLTVRSYDERVGSLGLGLAFLIIPTSVLFVVTQFTATHVFASRYLLMATPGLALAAGWAIGRIDPDRARRFMVVGILLASVVLFGNRYHEPDHWRDAIGEVNRIARSDTVVLFQGAFVESAQLAWLQNPERSSYLMAPLSYYPMRGKPVPLPYSLNEAGRSYTQEIVARQLMKTNEFILVQRYDFVQFRSFLDRALAGRGFESRSLGHFGRIAVYEFTRSRR